MAEQSTFLSSITGNIKELSLSELKIRLAENEKELTKGVAIGHNPKGTFLKKINQNISELKAQIIILEKKGGIFEGVFGEPTIYKETGKDVKTVIQTQAVNVPQTGAINAQGGCRGQKCNGNGNGQKTSCWLVYGQELQLTQAAVDYYKNLNVPIKKCGETQPVNGNLEQRVAELEQISWTYPEVIGTASQRSNVDVWNHLSQWVWGHGGEKWQAGGSAPKWDKPEPDAIVPLFSRLHTEQEMRLTEAHAHRQSIETKVEDLYTKKSDIGHKHGGNGGTDWGVVVMGIVAIILILLAVKYLFPLLGGLKGLIPKKSFEEAQRGLTFEG